MEFKPFPPSGPLVLLWEKVLVDQEQKYKFGTFLIGFILYVALEGYSRKFGNHQQLGLLDYKSIKILISDHLAECYMLSRFLFIHLINQLRSRIVLNSVNQNSR